MAAIRESLFRVRFAHAVLETMLSVGRELWYGSLSLTGTCMISIVHDECAMPLAAFQPEWMADQLACMASGDT